MDDFVNFPDTNVAVAPSSGGLTLTVTSGHGGDLPVPPFNAVVCAFNQRPRKTNATIIRVTGIVDDELTFLRTQEFSNDRTILVGDAIYAAVTKKFIDDLLSTSEARAAARMVNRC